MRSIRNDGSEANGLSNKINLFQETAIEEAAKNPNINSTKSMGSSLNSLGGVDIGNLALSAQAFNAPSNISHGKASLNAGSQCALIPLNIWLNAFTTGTSRVCI